MSDKYKLICYFHIFCIHDILEVTPPSEMNFTPGKKVCVSGIPRKEERFSVDDLPHDGLIVQTYENVILPCKIIDFKWYKNNFGDDVTYPYGHSSVILDEIESRFINRNDLLYIKGYK